MWWEANIAWLSCWVTLWRARVRASPCRGCGILNTVKVGSRIIHFVFAFHSLSGAQRVCLGSIDLGRLSSAMRGRTNQPTKYTKIIGARVAETNFVFWIHASKTDADLVKCRGSGVVLTFVGGPKLKYILLASRQQIRIRPYKSIFVVWAGRLIILDKCSELNSSAVMYGGLSATFALLAG